jgi:uncharacterized protein (DUF1697 family)
MPTFVAYLCAINVGGKTSIKMDTLCRPFEALGLSAIETYGAGGNVIFDARRPPNPSSTGNPDDPLFLL